MSEFNEPFEQPMAPTEYGKFRAEQHRQHLIESAANATQASMASHAATSTVLRAAHQGLYGHATPQELGAAVAARQAVVGSAYGGRPLERQGGLYDPASYLCAPAPPQRDLRQVDAPGGQPTTVSPLWAHMQGRQ